MRIVSSGVSALNPEIMGLGPIDASRQALERAGMTIDDIDLVEINEAFAAQVIPSAKHLGIEWDKLNVNGGSIALGHPFGMTGARIMTTLIHGLQEADKQFGLETMCVGGGQGMAMIIERMSCTASRRSVPDLQGLPGVRDVGLHGDGVVGVVAAGPQHVLLAAGPQFGEREPVVGFLARRSRDARVSGSRARLRRPRPTTG